MPLGHNLLEGIILCPSGTGLLGTDASGARERTLKVGDKAPDFALPNADETLVDSRALLARGPLVVTFYRGRW